MRLVRTRQGRTSSMCTSTWNLKPETLYRGSTLISLPFPPCCYFSTLQLKVRPLPMLIQLNENNEAHALIKINYFEISRRKIGNQLSWLPAYSPPISPAKWTSTTSSYVPYPLLSPFHSILILCSWISIVNPTCWLAPLHPRPITTTPLNSAKTLAQAAQTLLWPHLIIP